ncbi:MAG: sensor histidine kinase [Cyanophyceae cyanobacterium]
MAPSPEKSNPPLNPGQWSQAGQGWLKQWRLRPVGRSLSTKMMVVYGVALGISFTGVGIGFSWARQIESRAQSAQLEVLEDLEDVHHVQSSVDRLLIHHLAISNWLRSPSEISKVRILMTLSYLRQDFVEFEVKWNNLLNSDEFGEEEKEENVQGFLPTESEAQIAEQLNQEYKPLVQNYLSEVRLFFKELDNNLPDPETSYLTDRLSRLNQALWLVRIDSFTDKMSALISATEEEQEEVIELYSSASQVQLGIIYGSASLSGLMGLALLFWVTRSLMRPLKEMTTLTKKSIEAGEFSVKIPFSSSDEVGVLAEAFNAYTIFTSQLLEEKISSNAVLNSTLAELKRNQLQLVQSEKMSSLGGMIAGISHEINNPLGFISSNLNYLRGHSADILEILELYQRHYSQPVEEIQEKAEDLDLEFVQEDLSQIIDSMAIGSNRIREIVNSLRNFSRIDDSQVVISNLHEGIENTLLILKHRLKSSPESPSIQITKEYGEIPEVECYPGLLNQVFMNILANAIEALEEVYRSRLESSQNNNSKTANDPSSSSRSNRDYRITITSRLIENDQWVEITIADNGPGIPESVKQQIFEPFFTTKSEGKGTGMGMSISQQIVTEKHGGHFQCLSKEGQGTTFIIQLPVDHSDGLKPPKSSPRLDSSAQQAVSL